MNSSSSRQCRLALDAGLILAFIILAVILTPLYIAQMNNDGVAYLSLARRFAGGEHGALLNAYWSPAFPWLLGMLMNVGIPELLTAKIVSLSSGAILILLCSHIARQLKTSMIPTLAVGVTAVFLSLYWALDVISPDLLLTVFLLGSATLLLHARSHQVGWPFWIAGMLGGLSFWVKSAGLPIFVLWWLIVCGMWILRAEHRQAMIRNAVAGLLLCFILALPWLLVLRSVTGHWTLGESSRIIHTYLNPLHPTQSPMLTWGLIPPPDSSATSMWDNPPISLTNNQTPRALRSTIIDGLKTVAINIHDIGSGTFGFFWLLPALLVVAGIFVFKRGIPPDAFTVFLGLSAALFVCYVPLVVESRYFLSVVFFSVPLAGWLLSEYCHRPMEQIVGSFGLIVCMTVMPFYTLGIHAGNGRPLLDTSQTAQSTLAGKKLAADRWKNGLHLAGFTGGRYYGQPATANTTPSELARELEAQNIEYYATFVPSSVSPTGYTDITFSVFGTAAIPFKLFRSPDASGQ